MERTKSIPSSLLLGQIRLPPECWPCGPAIARKAGGIRSTCSRRAAHQEYGGEDGNPSPGGVIGQKFRCRRRSVGKSISVSVRPAHEFSHVYVVLRKLQSAQTFLDCGGFRRAPRTPSANERTSARTASTRPGLALLSGLRLRARRWT